MAFVISMTNCPVSLSITTWPSLSDFGCHCMRLALSHTSSTSFTTPVAMHLCVLFVSGLLAASACFCKKLFNMSLFHGSCPLGRLLGCYFRTGWNVSRRVTFDELGFDIETEQKTQVSVGGRQCILYGDCNAGRGLKHYGRASPKHQMRGKIPSFSDCTHPTEGVGTR